MDKKLLKYICCPKCKLDLKITDNKLQCRSCRRKYEIRNGIPVLFSQKELSAHLRGQQKYFAKETENSPAGNNFSPWQKSYQERFQKYCLTKRGEFFVDVGSGSGYLAVWAALWGLQVLAYDLNFKSLSRLAVFKKQLKLTNLYLTCGDAQEMGIKDELADVIAINAVLEHLPQETEAVREITRIAKRKARLMVTVPLAYRYIFPLFLSLNFIHDKRIGHLRRYDPLSIKTKFGDWKTIKIIYTGHLNKVVKTIINIFVKIFDEEDMEAVDKTSEDKIYAASNLITFLEKKI